MSCWASLGALNVSRGASYERANTLGFRCVADVPAGAPAPYHYRAPEAAVV